MQTLANTGVILNINNDVPNGVPEPGFWHPAWMLNATTYNWIEAFLKSISFVGL